MTWNRVAANNATGAASTAAPARTVLTPASSTPIEGLDSGGIELSHLWRYLLVATLTTGCALLSAWSRVDLVEISVALDQVEANLIDAKGEQNRLELEVATLTNPHYLAQVATNLELEAGVPIIDLTHTGALSQ